MGVLLVPRQPIQVQNNTTQCGEFVSLELSGLKLLPPYVDSNLAGNVEEPRIYTEYILFVKVKKKTSCMLEYSFTGSNWYKNSLKSRKLLMNLVVK